MAVHLSQLQTIKLLEFGMFIHIKVLFLSYHKKDQSAIRIKPKQSLQSTKILLKCGI